RKALLQESKSEKVTEKQAKTNNIDKRQSSYNEDRLLSISILDDLKHIIAGNGYLLQADHGEFL
ncbi:hypothetical protein A499_25388, partial [Niallia nealsonii AAU1]